MNYTLSLELVQVTAIGLKIWKPWCASPISTQFIIYQATALSFEILQKLIMVVIIFFLLAIRCSEPEEILNGDVDRKCQTFGCRISYSCRAGYELVGRQHRYCQADGSWSPRILPECVRKCSERKTPFLDRILVIHFLIIIPAIQCEVPRNPLNGRAVYASVSYNSLISYECNYGYMLIGDSVRRCERNKEWTGTEPHCKGTTVKISDFCLSETKQTKSNQGGLSVWL